MPLFATTIQRKLLLILLLAGFLPAVAGVLYTYWAGIVAMDNALGVYISERADAVAATLDQTLQKCVDSTRAASQALREGGSLEALTSSPDILFDDVQLLDASGASIQDDGTTRSYEVPLKKTLQRVRAADRVFIEEVAAGTTETILLFIARLSEDPERFLVCSAGSSRMLSFIPTVRAGGQAIFNVYSNRGQFLNVAPWDDALMEFVNTHYTSVRRQFNGWKKASSGPRHKEFLVAYACSRLMRMKQKEGLTSVDWTVLVEMDLEEALLLVRHFLWRNFFFGLGLAGVLVLLSVGLSRRFLRPIRQLHHHVEQLAQGDLSARIHIQTGDEIEHLADAFNDMTSKLHQSRGALEEQMRNVESKASHIALISEIGKSIVAAFDLPKLFETTHAKLANVVRYDAMAVALFDQTGGTNVHSVAGQDFCRRDVDREAIRLFCEARLIASTRGEDVIPPTGSFSGEIIFDIRFRQFCLLPLWVERGLMGALLLARIDDSPFCEPELRMLSQISQILALAIEHIELYDRMRHFADDLEIKVAERTRELGRAHEKLLQSERFAATGRLAANIAHEINNPLGIIKNYLRILRDGWRDIGQSQQEALEIVREEIDRITRIVRSLLDFYSPGQTELVEMDLNDEIDSLLPLMEAGFRRKNIQIERDLQAELPRPVLSRDHVRQMLLNLLKNAEDAISGSGTIRVSTRAECNDSGCFVAMEIADTGCGISPEDWPHIFEPFFTTKGEGKGTGLGLSVTYGIIQNFGGTIDISSAPSQGTTVRVRIPAEPKPALEEAPQGQML